MINFQRILIASDLTESTDSALRMGKVLQNTYKSEVTLIHIADISGIWDWPSLLNKFQSELKSGIEQKIKEQMNRCGVNFKYQILFGDSYYDLKEFLDHDFDLMIMGHRAERPLFSGSLAKKIIASSQVPVLIMTNDKPIDKVGSLVDLSSISIDAVNESKNLARMFDAEVHYFTAIPDIASKALMSMPFAVSNYAFSNEEKDQIILKAKTEIKSKLGPMEGQFIHVSISQFDISKTLSDQLGEHNINLAVLAKHNRGPLEKLFIGSVSKGFIDEFKGNMLILAAK